MKIKIPTFSPKVHFFPNSAFYVKDNTLVNMIQNQYSVGQVNRFGIHPDYQIDFIKRN